MTKEEKAKYQKEWYEKNKEKCRARAKQYYDENREYIINYNMEWIKKNKKKHRQYVRTTIDTLREETFQAYGNRCACCGESQRLFLEIDHIKNDGHKDKRNGRRKGGKDMYTQLRQQDFPKDRYQILCSNCNHGKRRNGGVCPHKSLQ